MRTIELTLGERMALFRSRAGLKPKDMAADFHVTVRSVHSWEHDVHEPSTATLRRWAELCGCDPSDLGITPSTCIDDWPDWEDAAAA
jgi:transcriptional regulator with XRE-family HTH domain